MLPSGAMGARQNVVDQMTKPAELYSMIGYHDYEALVASISQTVIPREPAK